MQEIQFWARIFFFVQEFGQIFVKKLFLALFLLKWHKDPQQQQQQLSLFYNRVFDFDAVDKIEFE